MLRVGIVEDTKQPYFCHIEKVDLCNHVEFKSLDCSSQQDYELRLAGLQAETHNKKWENLRTVAPWKVTIVTPNSKEIDHKDEDFVFSFHHALMDGPSARFFHQELVAALDYPSCTLRDKDQPDYELQFLAPPDLPAEAEKVVPFTLTIKFICLTLWKELAPRWLVPAPDPTWQAKPIDFEVPYKTRIELVEIPAATLKKLISTCRAHEATLTGLLHALILMSFAQRTPPMEAAAFKSTTPINYRPVFPDTVDPAYKETLTTCVTTVIEEHRALCVASFRSSGHDLDALIWSNAKRITQSVSRRRDTILVNDPTMLLKFVSDMDDFMRKKNGTERGALWELSNLGVLKSSPLVDNPAAQGWRITRAMFSNSASIIGEAISFSAISVPDGPLTIAMSYNDGVMSDELVKGVATDLRTHMERLSIQGPQASTLEFPGTILKEKTGEPQELDAYVSEMNA